MTNRNRHILLWGAFAAVLVLVSSIGSAGAYFTTYAEAKGSLIIELGDRTEIHETLSEWTKHVVIENKIGSQPVYVRARAFGAPGYTLAYEGAGWSDGGDGWYYCEEALAGGAMTAALDVRILDVPPQPEEGEHFQVIVVYEATPVLYDAAGAPYADWDAIPENGGMGHD